MEDRLSCPEDNDHNTYLIRPIECNATMFAVAKSSRNVMEGPEEGRSCHGENKHGGQIYPD